MTVDGVGSELMVGTNLLMGNGNGSQATLDITNGGTLDVIGEAYVGKRGIGTLNISGSSLFDVTGDIRVGDNASSVGIISVSATGSRLSSPAIIVGNAGTGTLDVTGNGTVEVTGATGYLRVGDDPDSSGNFAVADGTVVADQLQIGWYGEGDMTISAGADIDVGSQILVGVRNGGGGGDVQQTGGQVSVPDIVLGWDPNAVGNYDISGGSLTLAEYLTIGRQGTGTMGIAGGTVAVSKRVVIGRDAGSDGTLALTGGTLDATEDAIVGNSGTGTLSIDNGGSLTNVGAQIGSESGSTGTATIHGTDPNGSASTWNNSGSLYIGGGPGGNGGSGSLTIENSGHVEVTGTTRLWSGDDSLLVDGGSLTTGSLIVDPNANLGHSDGTITIDGGTFDNGSAGLPVFHDGIAPNTPTMRFINGANAEQSSIGIGDASILVEGNGSLLSAFGNIAVAQNPGTGLLSVTDFGRVDVGLELIVGEFGSAILTITDQALVTVDGTLNVDLDNTGTSFINMTSGGKLALLGDADDSLSQFLDLVSGTDAIRYWDDGLASWELLTSATMGVDYSLHYFSSGELAGYTLLTVGDLGDFDGDGTVDGSDFLSWQRGASLGPLADWTDNYGTTYSTTANATTVPEPSTGALTLVTFCSLLGRRRKAL